MSLGSISLRKGSDVGYIIYSVLIVLVIVGAWWLRRRSSVVDDYHERDFKDPPITGDISHLGGGKM